MSSTGQEDVNFATVCLWISPSCTKILGAIATILVSLMLKDMLKFQRLLSLQKSGALGSEIEFLGFNLILKEDAYWTFINATVFFSGFWIDTEFWKQLFKKTTQGYFESTRCGELRVTSWHITLGDTSQQVTSVDSDWNWLWSYAPAILALGRWKQEDHAFS